ncbi:MAG TPA: HD domain-containing phosphohydrolase [Pirellulaceae bacterium]|nr:HD domain-containing phosphohydrolase [Pirellulaceae bacterium]
MPRSQRILIVDDSLLNVRIMQKLLQDDYELETAMEGQTALQKLREFSPDVVLLDIMMPGISGYEVCETIKRGPFGPFTQVILVSGKASPQERLKGYQALADDYIVKPFEHEELLSKVRVHFRLREAQNQLWEVNSLIQQYNQQLEEIVSQRTAQVIATQDLAMFALAELAETRDPETGHHLMRMRAYAQRLAEELATSGPYAEEIDPTFLADLYRATPLHDIGKVGVPDAILQKPGKLTPAEFEMMKQHVALGAATLERAASHGGGGQFLTMAAQVARFHHERFDGRGYLQGQEGVRIPLCARIAALADVYDALTTARVYKPAMTAEEAHSMIMAESGAHFDPVIVEAFQRCFPDFVRIREELEHAQSDFQLTTSALV